MRGQNSLKRVIIISQGKIAKAIIQKFQTLLYFQKIL